MAQSQETAGTTCGSDTGITLKLGDFVAFHSLQHLPCHCFTPVLMKREPDVSQTMFLSVMYHNTRAVEDTVVSDDMKHFLQ